MKPREKLIKLYIIAICSLYSVFIFPDGYFGISLKVLLLCIWSLIFSFLYLYFILKERTAIHKPEGLVYYIFAICFIGNLIIVFYRGIADDGDLSVNLLWMTISFVFLVLSKQTVFNSRYLFLIVISSLVILAGILFWYIMSGYRVVQKAGVTVNIDEAVVYILISVAVSSICYCKADGKIMSVFYLSICVFEFFFLLLVQNTLVCLVEIFVLILIPVVYKAYAELIKRVMQLLFIYIFLWINVNVMINYSDYMNGMNTDNIRFIIYLELTLVIVSVAFFNYWDNLPHAKDLARLELPELKRIFQRILPVMIIGVLIFRKYCMPGGIFLEVYDKYGLIAFLLAVSFAIYILRLAYEKCFETEKELYIIITVLVVQAAFYNQPIVTAPVFVIFLSMALHDKTEKLELNM